MKQVIRATFALMSASLLLTASVAAAGDEAACEAIRAANVKTGSDGVQMKVTGYAFAKDTPKIYALGDQTCTHVRDETIDNQPTVVYREQYKAATGSTDATIWISKTTGRVLREEQDGDIVGKGKGHISYRWPAKR
jgi:hypothetical protein